MGVISSVRTAAAKALQPTLPSPGSGQAAKGEFARVLRQRLDQKHIALSAHAADRMIRRGLIPDDNTINQLNTAFEMASEKGSKEALFLLDNLAVIASVPNRTVKTALNRNGLEAGVFTQIDSAIVLSDNSAATEKTKQTDNQSPRSNGWTSNEGAAIQHGGFHP